MKFITFKLTDGGEVNMAAEHVTAVMEGINVDHPDFKRFSNNLTDAPKCTIVYVASHYFRVVDSIPEVLERLHNV
jgi:hypothetical protein